MGRLMSKKRKRKQSDIHQEDIEILSEDGFEDAGDEDADNSAESSAETETDRAEEYPESAT